MDRRTFLKMAAAGGLLGVARPRGVQASIVSSIFQSPTQLPLKPWEVELGVVDYELVKAHSYGPPELGFAKDIRSAPAGELTLGLAQWWDSLPGKVLRDFSVWMGAKWGIAGCKVETSSVYVSNEELLALVSGEGLDLVAPTNYAVETLDKRAR